MSMLWDQFLTEADKAVLARGKFGRRMGFGQQPVVLVIDAQRYMVGEAEDEKSWPSSCGEVGREAMRHIAQVVRTAHDRVAALANGLNEAVPDEGEVLKNAINEAVPDE